MSQWKPTAGVVLLCMVAMVCVTAIILGFMAMVVTLAVCLTVIVTIINGWKK
jgi:hypothetical protein